MSVKPRDGASVTRDGTTPEDRRAAAARECVAVAADSLEEAQRFLDLAAQALCGVRGMVREWRRLGALHDRARRAFDGVRGRADRLVARGRLVLDPDLFSRAERELAGAEGGGRARD